MTFTTLEDIQDSLASVQDVPYLECLTFEHPDLDGPLRLVRDTVDLYRHTGDHMAFPFDVRLHAQAEDSVAHATIVADTVDQRVMQALRSITSDLPEVTYEVVRHPHPDLRHQLNGGFERGPGDWGLASFIVEDPANARNGRWLHRRETSSGYTFASARFPAQQGQRWRASTWFRREGPSGQGRVTMRFHDSGGTLLHTASGPQRDGDGQWDQSLISFVPTDANVATVEIVGWVLSASDPDGFMMFDDFELARDPRVARGPIKFGVQGFQAAGGIVTLQVSFALDALNHAFPKGYFAPWNRQST